MNNVYNLLLFALGLSFAFFSDPVLHFRRGSGEKKCGLIYRTAATYDLLAVTTKLYKVVLYTNIKLLTLKATVDKVLLVSDND